MLLFIRLENTKTLNISNTPKNKNPIRYAAKLIDTQLEKEEVDTEEIRQKILDYLKNKDGTWAVSIRDLKSNKTIHINENEKFHAASTTKVLTAISAFKKVEAGSFNLNRVYFEGLTLEQMLQKMINQSDNNIWDYLNFFMGFDYMQKVGEELEMENTQISANLTTSKDLEMVLYNIYNGKAISIEQREMLFSWMEDTIVQDRIPYPISDEYVVYNKHGNYGNVMHDTAIVNTPNPYIIVVLSENSSSGVEVIREVSRLVYEELVTKD